MYRYILLHLPQAESGYISVRGLKAFKALNIEKELYPDHSREEIEENINKLKYKLEVSIKQYKVLLLSKLIGLYIQHPASETDTSLYGSLRQTLENVDLSNLT